jgi:hypothetical protein
VNIVEFVANGCLLFGVFTVHPNDEVVRRLETVEVGVVVVTE